MRRNFDARVTASEDRGIGMLGRSAGTSDMCGRYLFTSPLEAVQQTFKYDQMTNLGPNYNVAPTHEMPIVRWKQGDRRNELAIARWGLILHWAKDEKIAYSTIFEAFNENAGIVA
ncbi:MAG: SOS response-associated peptidase family protein [Pseudomonadota bacterium]